jgi:hypothetical protein
MNIEIKQLAFITVLCCSLWALSISGLTSLEGLGNYKLPSELPSEAAASLEVVSVSDKFDEIIQVLNVGLPTALLAIVLLVITSGFDSSGLKFLFSSVVMFLFASTQAMDAAAIIGATSEFSVDARVWWM